MSDVYSPLLGAALAFFVGSLVCLISARVSRSAHLFRLARIAMLLTLLALAIAVVSHVRIGHTPGTDAALGPAGFVAEHPLVPALTIATLLLLAWTRGHTPGKTTS